MYKNNRKLIPLLLLSMLFAFLFSGCTGLGQISSTADTVEKTNTEQSTTQEETKTQTVTATDTTQEEIPYAGPVNPLTGLPVDEDISEQRPYAIMFNNLEAAQPQLGISKADIIYETLAEGGITRMMAVFQDISGVGEIGSVRSSRSYFLDLAQPYDAIYIHAGASNQAYDDMVSRGIVHLDGVNGSKQDIFYRDAERRKTMAYEHCLVTSGELISEYLPTYNIRLEHESGCDFGMVFAKDGTPAGGQDVDSLSVYFTWGSINKSTTFDYNAEDDLYYVSQYDAAYVDGNDDTQVSVTNVIVIYADMSLISGDSSGRISVDLVGSGEGYFICGGKYVDINWSKDSYSSRFVYTLKNGGEIVCGQGKTYICIIPKAGSVEFS